MKLTYSEKYSEHFQQQKIKQYSYDGICVHSVTF